PPRRLPICASFARSPGERDRLPILQLLGRAWGVGLRHARRLVQPLRPAPRAPTGQPRFRDPDTGRTAGAFGPRTVLREADATAQPAPARPRMQPARAFPPNKCKKNQMNPRKIACISLDSFGRNGAFQWVTANPNKKIFGRRVRTPSCIESPPPSTTGAIAPRSCQWEDIAYNPDFA